jgi:hypothetical protein
MSRRSRPPRTRKSRNPEAAEHDVVVIVPPTESPSEDLVRRALGSPPPSEANEELAAVDAGWD